MWCSVKLLTTFLVRSTQHIPKDITSVVKSVAMGLRNHFKISGRESRQPAVLHTRRKSTGYAALQLHVVATVLPRTPHFSMAINWPFSLSSLNFDCHVTSMTIKMVVKFYFSEVHVYPGIRERDQHQKRSNLQTLPRAPLA